MYYAYLQNECRNFHLRKARLSNMADVIKSTNVHGGNVSFEACTFTCMLELELAANNRYFTTVIIMKCLILLTLFKWSNFRLVLIHVRCVNTEINFLHGIHGIIKNFLKSELCTY